MTYTSGKNGATETKITLPPEMTKRLDKIYERVVSKTVIPQRWETNEMSLPIVSAYCLVRVPGHSTGKGVQTKPRGSP